MLLRVVLMVLYVIAMFILVVDDVVDGASTCVCAYHIVNVR